MRKAFIDIDRYADYIPGVSTVTNIVDLFLKLVYIPVIGQPKSSYLRHVKDKETAKTALLCLPIVNIAAAVFKKSFEKSYITGVKEIKGSEVEGEDQEDRSASGYNWKEAAWNKKADDGKLSELGQYAHEANNAWIAYRGTLSNYQRVPIFDPASKITFKSAEHMFHYYKFGPEQSDARDAILAKNSPDQARREAGRNRRLWNDGGGRLWGMSNLNLMTYIQLVKAAEKKTGMREFLLKSGDDFIIEDTSKTGERNWGDAGDGSGQQKLGLAQMRARDVINQWAKEGVDFENRSVLDAKLHEFYDAKVQDELGKYYERAF